MTSHSPSPIDSDPQVSAIARIVDVLLPLQETDRISVLRYIVSRFDCRVPQESASPIRAVLQTNEVALSRDNLHASFAELYHAYGPQSDAEKALVAGYFLQVSSSQPSFDSFSANRLLQDLGHKIGNITRAFEMLVREQPQLAIQIRKAGSTKQARKSFRLTQAGIDRVKSVAISTQR